MSKPLLKNNLYFDSSSLTFRLTSKYYLIHISLLLKPSLILVLSYGALFPSRRLCVFLFGREFAVQAKRTCRNHYSRGSGSSRSQCKFSFRFIHSTLLTLPQQSFQQNLLRRSFQRCLGSLPIYDQVHILVELKFSEAATPVFDYAVSTGRNIKATDYVSYRTELKELSEKQAEGAKNKLVDQYSS